MNIEDLARPEIVAMKPYSSARKEAPGKGVLLNANEAPWPLLEGDSGLNRYPDPQPERLLRRLARLYGVAEDSLLITRGSDEGIDLLTRVFCRAGEDAILQCPPAFGMYRIAAQAQGADVVSVPRHAGDFSMDEQGVLDTFDSDRRIKLVFLTSPSNPTGDVLGDGFLKALLAKTRGRSLIVVDEAYTEFTDHPSATALIDDHEHLVVLRTLSKAWAAAGLRCGSVLARPAVIDLLRRVIAPYPLPSPVVSLAMQMLDDKILAKQGRLMQKVRANKNVLLSMLEGRRFVRKIFPGEANFVLIRVNEADALLTHCAKKNVILRGFPSELALRDCIRISVGSEEDLAQLERALDEWENKQ